jgi:hypothetical protein
LSIENFLLLGPSNNTDKAVHMAWFDVAYFNLIHLQAEVEWLAAMEKRKAPSAADTANILQGAGQHIGGTSRNKNTTDSLNDTSRSKAEFRRAARKQREADWAAFNTTRPDDK